MDYIQNLSGIKEKKSWEEFRDTGLLWWVNRIIHLFGWAILMEYDDKDRLIAVYPAKVSFRGFSEKAEDEMFRKLTKYLKSDIDEIEEDVK